ncbi:uncharacterized protein [Setaria viridis]|uniref:uncharacterized protein n=1 Tax=Setaria viridis TaxID=4556 RepID=UPI003B3B8520
MGRLMFVCTVRLTNSFLHIVGALQQLDCTSSAALRILKNGTEDDDRLSALPDHILVDIMHRLDLRTLMRASTLSTRRKQLPYLLTNLYIHVDGFKPRTETSATSQLNDLVDLYTETTKRLLAPTADRSINLLRLRFCLTDPHLESIGSTVTSVLERGNTKFLEFIVVTELQDLQVLRLLPLRVQMSSTCESSSSGSLSSCVCVYDTWTRESPPVVFGHVPSLRGIDFGCAAMNWQPPFMLSDWLSGTRLETVRLDFQDYMIWIKPEDPKLVQPVFGNLTDLYLSNIFAECDLEWTVYLLEAAPFLKNFFLTVNTSSFAATRSYSPHCVVLDLSVTFCV